MALKVAAQAPTEDTRRVFDQNMLERLMAARMTKAIDPITDETTYRVVVPKDATDNGIPTQPYNYTSTDGKIESSTNVVYLTEESPRVAQPPDLKDTLFPTQLACIHDMIEKEKGTRIHTDPKTGVQTRVDSAVNVLGMNVGSGKSKTVLGLISHTHEANGGFPPQKQWSIKSLSHASDISVISFKRLEIPAICAATIIVAPNALCHQWRQELETLKTTAEGGKLRWFVYPPGKMNPEIDPHEYDIIVIPNSKTVLLRGIWSNIIFTRLVVDEAHHINNLAVFYLKQFMSIWLVTGTYEVLFDAKAGGGHGNESRGLIAKIQGPNGPIIYTPEMKPWIVVQAEQAFFDKTYKSPPIYANIYHCQPPKSITAIRGELNAAQQALLDAGDTMGVLRSLGCKLETGDTIFTALTKTIDERIADIQKNMQHERDQARLHTLQLSLERAYERRKSIADKLKTVADEECQFCCEPMRDKTPTVAPCCNVVGCYGCIVPWVDKSHHCPYCRSHIGSIKNLVPFNASGKEIETAAKPVETDVSKIKKVYSKAQVVHAIVSKPEGKASRRVLVFAGFEATLKSTQSILTEANINWKAIEGGASIIEGVLKDFAAGNVDALVINSKNNSVGFNLQIVSDIIIMHPIDKATLTQCIGRADRLGRERDFAINLHFLIHPNTEAIEAACTEGMTVQTFVYTS